MKTRIQFLVASALLASPLLGLGQAPPPLGVAASFAMFTAVGAIDNNGPSIINGDIGTNAGAFNGFPPGVINGSIHVADTRSTQAATAVQTAYGYYSTNIPCVTPVAVYGGTPAVTMGPGSYCVGGATTLAGTLILDGGGDPNALFYLKVAGALTTAQNSQVLTQNGANPANVYWQIGGLTTLGQNSVMRGTMLVDGGIILITGATIIGRGLSRAGAITLTSATATVPGLVAPTVNATTWLGNGTMDWFNSSNWSNGVPTSAVNALVPTNTAPYPSLTGGSAAANGLTIGAGASLMQSGGSLDLQAGLNNSGTVSATAGQLNLSGTSGQLIGGSGSTQLWSVNISNPAGAIQTGPLGIHGALMLAGGNLNTNNQTLTLLSDATGTALVANTGGVVNGAATMQRYIAPAFNGGAGYRHYSAPVSNTTFADLATPGFVPVFNQAYNNSPTPAQTAPFPNVFDYSQARITAAAPSFEQGYFVPAANDPMALLAGYSVNISASQKVDLRGTLNNGPITRNALARGPQPQSGWHLLGNPYPSPLDFSETTGVTRTNMDDAIYVYQSTGQYTGQYRSYINGIGNPVISAMQGFFTRVSSGQTSGSFGLNNNARATELSFQPAFNRSAALRPLLQLTLQGSTQQADETAVYFESGATPAFDGRFDAYKLPGTAGLRLGSLAGNEELSVNGLAPLTATTNVVLNVAVPAAGTYTLSVAALLNFAPGTQVLLLDTQTGARVDLSQQPSYRFTTTSTALPGRFSLRFAAATPLASQPAALGDLVQLFPNPAHGRFTVLLPAEMGRTPVAAVVLNPLGQRVAAQTVAMNAAGATAQFDLTGLAPGIYSLRLASANGQVVKRIVVE